MLSSSSSLRHHSRGSTSSRRHPRPFVTSYSRRICVVAQAKKRSPVTEGLQLVLKDELKIEKERYRTPEAVLEGPPGGFELEDRPHSNVLLLSRSHGSEEIYVEVDLDTQQDETDEDAEAALLEEEDEEGSMRGLPPVAFSVNVVKGRAALGFSCQTDGEAVVISHVSLNDSAGGTGGEDEEDDDSMPYTGPLFTELDDTLQQAFSDYLEERGITAEFGAYLVELVHDKLEVEYMAWLTRVQDFVAS
uniref:Mitochondrial glycoprotein domain-containing protein n=1 Tax=Tetradesmus obliquus TaxID=3088 RepID=A0A383V4P1_TETOB|eukprot:jgi/Sobl393_1/9187/SZX60578.1